MRVLLGIVIGFAGCSVSLAVPCWLATRTIDRDRRQPLGWRPSSSFLSALAPVVVLLGAAGGLVLSIVAAAAIAGAM